MSQEYASIDVVNILTTKVAVLESKMSGVEQDLDTIKSDIRAMRDNFRQELKAIRENFNKLIIGGLGASVLFLLGIIVNIIISAKG